MDDVRDQLLNYEHQIKQYLDKLEAKIDTYKFSVERQPDGLTVDIAFRATVHTKKK